MQKQHHGSRRTAFTTQQKIPGKLVFSGKTPLSEQSPTKRGIQRQQGCGYTPLQIIPVKPSSIFLHFAVSEAPTKPNC